uniref:KASH domain-containing protein n=1 Tax=Naja naja TaxID=35670 RepID=A0A8C6XIP5_NAJNA
MEKYHSFKNSKERICDELNNAEKVLWKYLYYIPVSYKDSLEHSEQSKMLLSQLLSTKEELMKLRRDSQSLSLMCKENDGGLIAPIVSMLWLKWLCLFNIAKEWEGKCEEQNQEWKSVSEELERETIILDSLQEELPESLQDKQQATKEELEEFLESASNYIENLDTEKLLLRLILCRLRNILSVPASLSGKESLPIVCEIQNMQQRTEELCQKAQTEKEAMQFEMVYRTECSEELKAMKTSLQGIISQLCGYFLQPILKKFLILFSFPVGIEEHLEDCKGMLHDLEEKVSTEFLKNSPHYNTEKKIEDINKGLQAIENMLHQKSENIAKAKEVQKRIWDLLDLWHYKMNELDSEVQDIVEQNPHQAQELIDRLMIPLQQYQHVSQHAERRTTDLNRVASKLEECDELLKSIQVWLENTSRLLTEEVKSDSAKALNKHASALEMALEDSEQKQSILSAISPELKELSALIETDSMVQELTEVNEQVKALQQKIMEILPCIQHLANDVEAIESEVKTMEKDIEKIKTILSPSEDTLDFSPKEHLKHCKVILAHICPMKKAVAEMQSYKAKLRLTDMRMQPLSVFQRTKQLLKELKVLERLTEKQNTLLEVKANLIEWLFVNLLGKYLLIFNFEVEGVKQQIALLCQQKEDILTAMKNALVELHQNQEPPETEDSDLESPEENGNAVELQVSSYSFLFLSNGFIEIRFCLIYPGESGCSFFQGKSSTQLTNPPECLWRSLSNTKATKDTVKSDSEPAQVLHVCQTQIAELELWLDQVKESLGSEAQICQMQQSVEQHLAACQVMLTEIEQKVMWLLEECKGTATSNSSGLEQETENLSLNLKNVKCKLEKVQRITCLNIVRTPTIEELKTYTAQLDNLSQKASTQVQENETGENALSLDEKLFELFLAISRCLNNMEQMLGTCVLSSEEAPVQQVLYETLSAELQKLHTDIGDKKDDLLKSITSAGGNSERFSQCFSNLQAWLQLTQTTAASRSESMKTEMDHYINYQNEIRHLYDALIEKKSSLQQFFIEMSGHNISKQLQQMDVFESELQNFETQAVKLRDHGERVHLPVAATHDVYKLEEVLDDLWEFLRVKQKELSSSFIKEQQCEFLLQGFAELIDLGKKKLVHVSKLKITSRSDLELHLQNHKSFFCKLNDHMLLVQKVAASILQNREKYWKDMVEKIKSLEEEAIEQGTHLEKVLQDWRAFDESYVSFCQKLEALLPTMPFVALVEETEERIMERTQLLQKNIEGEQARYYQIVKEGKNLTELLRCPELQSKIEKLEHQWASFSQRELHFYNKDTKELNVWLESAQQNVNYWKEQSLNASQDQNTVRNHIQSLLEFSKEVDNKSSLKSSVRSTGNQLLLIKESDDAKLRSALAEYEQRWTNLVVQLPGIQEKFHQLLMAKLSSYEAITELNAWMNCIDQQRRDEVVINLQSSASLKGLLRWYKEYVMEMNFKQWIVDYVNQSLLQLTPCDVESKRYERTSFAECLGELNMNWHHLQGTLNEKIKELEHILESVVKNENKAQSLGSWLEAQSRRLKHLKSPASSILAQGTLKDCKVLENQLAVKSKEVDQLKNNLTQCSNVLVNNFIYILFKHRLVCLQVAQLKSSTESALECWKTYDEAWDEIRLMLANAAYCLEHSKNAFITMKSLKKQVEDLQVYFTKTNVLNSLVPQYSFLKIRNIREYYLQACESGDSITLLAEPETQNLLQEKLQPLQRISYLEKMLQMKADVYQVLLIVCYNQLLSLTSLSPEMERLNEVSFRLPLCDFTVKRLQNLNRQWTQKTALVLEQCSELQKDQSDDKKFLQQCQNWVQFLERMKESLKENMPATLEKLQEQQKEYEILQTEISINQQIFSCLVSKVLNMLESGETENRTEFISRLTLLKEQWQSAVRMAHRKKIDIDSLVKQWQKFTTLLQDLTKFLMDTSSYIAAVKSQEKYHLDQIRNLNHKFKNKKILQKRWQTRYSLILDTGEKLLSMVAPEAKVTMHLEMNKLRANWDNTQLQLEKITRQFQGTIQVSCINQLSLFYNKSIGPRVHLFVLEKSLTNWSQNAKELDAQKMKLAQFILPEDVMVLREQTERLHSQWEELCLRVSLHKQDIEEQLNAWIVFNEKNKELCTWLMQMEEKVPQSADISIEDMIDKLQKDYMEEINLFNESQLVHFKQMGNQLIKSSNQSRGAEIEEKLNKINDRWQHLLDIIGGRVKKLKDTFAFIQQLDKNMSHLHTWLARIESELSKPIVYDICDDQEIQRRLAEQQDLQRDIEQHTAGVESVFNICEILLHDSDACANETECDSIQQTTRSLERRWRNICAMSIERRMKIEATWRLWQKFLEDYSRFEVWLKTAEKTAAYPNSSEILYVTAKEELKKFEAFQRQIHERLTQLELINKQYRRLARENRTDSANKLKQMVYEGNHRWDNLQKRVTAILRRLKHFTNQWEEFMGTKDNIILVWLTEMDLQLTNVEHFSKSDFDDKMRQLNGFQREIMLNTSKIDQLIASGLYLIQKSEPEDAIILEEELEEFRSYCQEVFGRVARFHQRLISWHPGLEDEKESSENEADSDHARGMEADPWPKKTVQEGPPSQQSLCHLIPIAGGPERSGCETPVSVDSIPLEWDHTGDVGGSSSPEDEEEDSFFSALSDVEITEHPEAYLKMTTKALKAASGRHLLLHVLYQHHAPIGTIERWELLQVQDLSNKLRMKQTWQQWQQLNADLTNIDIWLDKMEEEMEGLQEEEPQPVNSIQAIDQRVKKLKDMLKAYNNYKALVLSVNLTSKDFKQTDSTGCKELQNRLRRVNLRWEKANILLENWKKNLQKALIHCQDFHEQNQKLLLWLAAAETRRHQAQVKEPNGDPHRIQESQKELMQLEKELLERQLQVNTLQEIAAYLLVQPDGEKYTEANEKVHVIGKKLKQLLEGVSCDLKASQGRQQPAPPRGLLSVYVQVACPVYKLSSVCRMVEKEETNSFAPKKHAFFCRVLRAALPLQLFLLLLLFLASLIPISEEDYSCTQTNNFARSFYPMLRYINGPPPT